MKMPPAQAKEAFKLFSLMTRFDLNLSALFLFLCQSRRAKICHSPASSVPWKSSCILANGELICVDILVYSYGVLRAKIQDRDGSEPKHLTTNSAK